MKNSPEQVSTREELAMFVAELAKSAQSQQSGWENSDLPSFLTALAAWIDDMDGYFVNRGEATPDRPQWHTLAQMLMAATMYE